MDPIAEILSARYGVSRGKSWHRLLVGEYGHAVGTLKQAEATFAGGRSSWLAYQNSFNQIVFLSLQRHFAATRHPAACTTVNRNGQLVNFGATLEANGPFSHYCPTIGDCFRDMNARRNHLPMSHPYEQKTAAQSRHLTAQERNNSLPSCAQRTRTSSRSCPDTIHSVHLAAMRRVVNRMTNLPGGAVLAPR